jgi:hypothetical protein
LRKILSSGKKGTDSEVEKLIEIYNHFTGSSRPSFVHFEVILLGYRLKPGTNTILSKLAKSQAPEKLVKMETENAKDDLYGVVSRILSGRIINTGPKRDDNG